MRNKNNNKYMFPIDIKGDIELPDFDISDNFSVPDPKDKIDSEYKEISIEKKNNKKKCQSKKLV